MPLSGSSRLPASQQDAKKNRFIGWVALFFGGWHNAATGLGNQNGPHLKLTNGVKHATR
jgi:hypothetical protein